MTLSIVMPVSTEVATLNAVGNAVAIRPSARVRKRLRAPGTR